MSRSGETVVVRARPFDVALGLPFYALLLVILGGATPAESGFFRALPYVVVGLAVLTRCWRGVTRITPVGVADRRYVPQRAVTWEHVVGAPEVRSRLGVARVELPTTAGWFRLSTPGAIGPFGRPRVDHVRELLERARPDGARVGPDVADEPGR